ncbi:MAG: sensor histidine kinase [Gammaproteobacteria bacterium]|nr:MAG: sensor histidine kinase [Gammaproteobacteria bacterium]
MELSEKPTLTEKLRTIVRRLTVREGDTKALDTTDHFLPNFCEARMVLSVFLIAEILALVISLVMPVPSIFFSNYFEALLQISLFIQWIALASAAGLCLLRNYLRKLPNRTALITAYLMLLLTTLLVNEATVWILWGAGKISTPRPEWYAHLHFQNLTISALINALALGYFMTKQELKQRTASEARARIQALQSRIRPHFVFNAMNIIASLTRSDPAKAETAIEDMSELFRMMLNDEETLVPIKKEIEVAEKYLALESLRLDDRLQVAWNIGKFPRKAIMPTLTLQPLLETAINKGIEPSATGGTITIKLWEENDKIHIHMTNPITHRRGNKRRPEDDEGKTLENISKRFDNHYGDLATLTTDKTEDLFTVKVSLPLRDAMNG